MHTSHPLRRARATNSTATSFTAKVPTATAPTGSGVFNVFDAAMGYATNTYMPRYLNVTPFGEGANNDVFNMRVWGWSRVHNPGGTDDDLWIPHLVADWAVTLGNVSATAIASGHLMADTIVEGDGDTGAETFDATDDKGAAHGQILLRGFERFEFDFDMVGSTVGGNAYWRLQDDNG